jgi:PadR family transcriptional regulator PadR
MHEELFENLRLELRRGCLIVAVLAQLRTEQYGYTLCKHLGERGLAVEEGTVYPLLRRLEDQGLLVSQWREENKRKKRFYRLSELGETILARLLAEWNAINAALERVVGEAAAEPRVAADVEYVDLEKRVSSPLRVAQEA